MDSRVWKEPEKFQPERFLDRNGKFFGGDRVIPFALGRYNIPNHIIIEFTAVLLTLLCFF